MLDLYRASAGSGKTYTLTRQFIWYYLTITDEHKNSRLRTDAELADSARHILAVTFTNKATNEMQMRIVDSLNALAYSPVEFDRDRRICSPVYMKEFTESL